MSSPQTPGTRPASGPGSHRRARRAAVLAVLTALAAAAGLSSLARHSPGPPVSPAAARGYRITAAGEIRKTSTGWAGYAVRTGSPHTQVSATWRIPAIRCTRANANASFWAGLGGIKTTRIEQAGTQALCRSGRPVYGSWWQLYPRPAVPAGIPVHPGDLITAQVTITSGTAVAIDLSDLSTGRRTRITRRVPGAQQNSAEIIAEQSGDTIGPLSDFGAVTFTAARIDRRPLDQAGAHTLDMVDPAGHLRAIPGPITNGGTFTIRATQPSP
jgi:hypothetical protein